jgi:hypothetical protein
MSLNQTIDWWIIIEAHSFIVTGSINLPFSLSSSDIITNVRHDYLYECAVRAMRTILKLRSDGSNSSRTNVNEAMMVTTVVSGGVLGQAVRLLLVRFIGI